MEFSRVLDPETYTRQALADTRHAFRDYCIASLVTRGDGRVVATIQPTHRYADDARRVVLEFLNYALDRSVQMQLEKL